MPYPLRRRLSWSPCESTFAYLQAARTYLEAWDKSVAFYSDKHGVFRVNHLGALGSDRVTQFGRPLHALSVEIIYANSSPAKGRVERAHKTLQDRLSRNCGWRAPRPWPLETSSSRLSWPITTRALLRRRRTPKTYIGRCRPATFWRTRLPGREERTLSHALTLQYDKVIFILEPSEPANAAIGKRVTVLDYPDGRLAIRYNDGVELPYRTID